MLRLYTFGTLALGDAAMSAARNVGLQGLALLARLAVAGERGLSRDKILALFWPETDQRRASHSLSQTLHRLRASTGHEDLFVGTRTLALNAARVASDAAELEEALLERQVERARKLYAGPFLDGVFLPDAQDFEKWCDAERRRFATAFTSCLREAAAAAAATGDQISASALWREILAVDKYDDAAAVELVRSLSAAGDVPGALRESAAHQARRRDDLQLEPLPALQSLVQKLQTRPSEPVPSQPVGADALCLKARQHLHSFTEEGMRRGIECAEQALALEPNHVVAHVTLGSLGVILSQHDGDRSLRRRGMRHCEIAASLAPGIAEAHVWLAVGAHLEDLHDEAEAFGVKAAELAPDNPFTLCHLAFVKMWYAVSSGDWYRYQSSATAYQRALSIDARNHYILMGAAALYSHTGNYEDARLIVDRLCHVEGLHGSELSMIGGLTFRGHLAYRELRLAEARAALDGALESYRGAQVFAPYVRALTHCTLGDVHRAEARYDAAVSAYQRGLDEVRSIPKQIGAGYLAVRLETRLAAAYNRMRIPIEEETHRKAAESIRATWDSNSFSYSWLAGDGAMHADWAIYHAARGNADAMVASLESAVAVGWGDVAVINADPALAFFADDERVRHLVERVATREPLVQIKL